MRKEKTKIEPHKVAQRIKDFAGLISAILAIGAALIGAGHWIVKEISASTNNRIDALEAKIDANQDENELSITRLELMNLLQTDPDNIIEIEKLARKYFNPPLNGNSYMTSVISRWCETRGIDCGTIILK